MFDFKQLNFGVICYIARDNEDKPTRMAIIKKTSIPGVGDDVEKPESSAIVCENLKQDSTSILEKQFGSSLKR